MCRDYSKVKPNMNGFMGGVGYFSHVLHYTAESSVFDILPIDTELIVMKFFSYFIIYSV